MMQGTTARRKPLVTAKKTLIDQILKRLKEIEVMLLQKRCAKLERIVDYAQIVESLNPALIRENPSELGRINGIILTLKREIMDEDVLVRIKLVQDLIKTTLRQYAYSEE